jgi:diguanylate cyclase (GGDEF)-like protein/PAS domain S-box-containing protein
MFSSKKDGLPPDPANISELDLKVSSEREELINRILLVSAGMAFFGVLVHALTLSFGFVYYFIVAGVMFYLYQSQSLGFKAKSYSLLLVVYLTVFFTLFVMGEETSATVYLIICTVLIPILFGAEKRWFSLGIVIFTWFGLWYMFYRGWRPIYQPYPQYEFFHWLYAGIDLLFAILALTQSQDLLQESQDYVGLVSKQKRELMETRAELTLRTKTLDYERYLLHTLLDNVNERIFFKDLNGRFLRVSRAIAESAGMATQQMVGKTNLSVFVSDYAERLNRMEQDVLQSGQPQIDQIENEQWLNGETTTWVITSRLPLRDEEGRIVGLFGTSHDITEIKRAQEAAQRRARQLSLAAEVGRAVTSTFDLTELLRKLVRLMQSSFGFYTANVWLLTEEKDYLVLRATSRLGEEEELPELKIGMDQSSVVTDVCRTRHVRLVNSAKLAPEYKFFELFNHTKSLLVAPLRLGQNVVGVLDVRSDDEEAFYYEDQLLLQSLADQVAIAIENARLFAWTQRLAITDTLTGLYNRRHFFEMARREAALAQRYDHPLSIAIMDIDRFKRINDTYGHLVGDHVLRALAELCQRILRQSDLLGRYGGEEFVVLMPDTQLEEGFQVAERLRKSVEEMEIPSARGPIQITISIGVAGLQGENKELEAALDCADQAMYAAKSGGRNQVRTFCH